MAEADLDEHGRGFETPALEVRDLQCATLFQVPHFSVAAGQVAVILGRSGAGKSTLADYLFELRGRAAPDGTVTADGRGALLLQEGAVFDDLTVADNLGLVLGWERRPDADPRASLRAAGLPHPEPLLARAAATLSGGEKRRVAIARTLPLSPSFFFFDEPSVGLDPGAVRELARTLRRLAHDDGRAVVVVTHDLLFTAEIADRVWMIEDGELRLRWDGDPAGLPDADAARLVEATRAAQLEQACFPPSVTSDAPAEHRAPAGPSAPARLLETLGGVALEGVVALAGLARARPGRGAWRVLARAVWMAGVSGAPFFALIGLVLGTVLMAVLHAGSPAEFGTVLDAIGGTPLVALTPPLAGFLFVARSGSALVAWLGGKVFTRQVDALQTLGVRPDTYLRGPVWLAAVLSFGALAAAFLVALWVGASLTAEHAFGARHAFEQLSPLSAPASEWRSAITRLVVYAILLASVITFAGLEPKRTPRDVAQSITWAIIAGTVGVTAGELLLRLPHLVGG